MTKVSNVMLGRRSSPECSREYEEDPRPKTQDLKSQTRMRSRASHPGPHQTWVPAPCLRSPPKRRRDCFSLTALERECRICRSQLPIRVLAITNPHLLRVGQRPFLLRKASRGRRPQRPGNQLALARSFWMFPPAIRFRGSPAATGLPQSSGKLRNSHVSLQSISPSSSLGATEKNHHAVQNLWTIVVPCGQTRKTKNYSVSCSCGPIGPPSKKEIKGRIKRG